MTQPPRRPRPTRTPTSRPRRIAGQRPDASLGDPGPRDVDLTKRPDVPTEVEEVEAVEAVEAVAVDPSPPPVETTGATTVTAATGVPSEPSGRGSLVLLLVVIVLLLGVGVAEIVYLASDREPQGSARLSAERPVQVPDLEVRRVVDQAASAADLILSASSQDYEGQVAQATATMTEPFAVKYRETKADIEEEFVAAQTEVVVDISAQGVVSASDDEIVALLFLTQTTQKGTRGGVQPVQYRVTVTMSNTPDGWLVSDLVAL